MSGESLSTIFSLGLRGQMAEDALVLVNSLNLAVLVAWFSSAERPCSSYGSGPADTRLVKVTEKTLSYFSLSHLH